jgi:hypothetical protein
VADGRVDLITDLEQRRSGMHTANSALRARARDRPLGGMFFRAAIADTESNLYFSITSRLTVTANRIISLTTLNWHYFSRRFSPRLVKPSPPRQLRQALILSDLGRGEVHLGSGSVAELVEKVKRRQDPAG